MIDEALKRIIIRVVKRRYDQGESIDKILKNYDKLQSYECENIKTQIIPERFVTADKNILTGSKYIAEMED